MQYTPKPLEGNNNVSATHPLFDLFRLLGGGLALVLVIYILLGFSADLLLMHLPVKTENAIFEPAATSYENNFVKKLPERKSKVAYARVNKIMARLLKAMPSQERHYRPVISLHREVNAFAIPGGLIIINQGLLDKVEDDDALAFVLAHELGHFENRDHLKGIGRNFVTATISLAFLGFDKEVAQVMSTALKSKNMQFSRFQESQADCYGTKLMTRAGYNPKGGETFLRQLLAEEGSFQNKLDETFEFLASHPASAQRILVINKSCKLAAP